jgi:hypothetical protein
MWLRRLCTQGQAQLTRRMAVRPASLASKAHRRLTAALDRRHVKFNRVQRTVTVLDPKKAKSDLEKDQEARIRSRYGPHKALLMRLGLFKTSLHMLS